MIMCIASCAGDIPVETQYEETVHTETTTPAPPEPIELVPGDETYESNYYDYPDVPVVVDAPFQREIATFPGRIAIVTDALSHWREYPSRRAESEDRYRSAEAIVKRYGSDRVIHKTWSTEFGGVDDEMMTRILTELAEDPEIVAIIINAAIWWGLYS